MAVVPLMTPVASLGWTLAIGLGWVCEWQIGKAWERGTRIADSTASDSIFRVAMLDCAVPEQFYILALLALQSLLAVSSVHGRP